MFFSKKTIAAAVASQILIHSVAYAQPSLEEVVVTAQKREQNMQDVGISVTAMSGDNLRSLGITSSADIARFTPNLSIVSLAGEGNQPVKSQVLYREYPQQELLHLAFSLHQ